MEIRKYPHHNDSLHIDLPSYFLPSIDLEDLRKQSSDWSRYQNRVPLLVEESLRYFADAKCKITYFVVGETAAENPSSIRDILSEGHEIACHTNDHKPLTLMSPTQLHENLKINLATLGELGATSIVGFRSPIFSLTDKTHWAWSVIKSLGFRYSSSVLPAANPQFGWKEFHPAVTLIDVGIWELPIPITHLPKFQVPFTGGAYLRVLPRFMLSLFCRWYEQRDLPLTSYFHPYDIDMEQERFRIFANPFFNWLIYFNRQSTLLKIGWFLDRFPSARYVDYINLVEEQLQPTLTN